MYQYIEGQSKTDQIIDELRKIGIDTDHVITRLGGSVDFYILLCHKFKEDANFTLYQDAYSKLDYQQMEFYIHTLKGIAANLGFTRLEMLSKSIMDDLKVGEVLYLKYTTGELREEYNMIIEVLQQFM